MGIIDKIRSFKELMPLADVRNYEAYWNERLKKESEKTAPTLDSISPFHRKAILAKVLEDGKSLLDVGCGNCSFFDLISKKKPNMILKGCEYTSGVAEIGAKKGYDVIVKDLTKEELTESFDYITVLNVLEHVQQAEEILLNLRNKFRDSLFVSVPNFGYIKHRLHLGLFGKTPNTGCFYHIREHIRFWTRSDFHRWADYYGFRIVNEWGGNNMGLRFLPGLFSSNILYELKRKTDTP